MNCGSDVEEEKEEGKNESTWINLRRFSSINHFFLPPIPPFKKDPTKPNPSRRRHRRCLASKFGLAGGIPERRVQPIWDAVDSRQFKAALKLCVSLLAKYPNPHKSPYALTAIKMYKIVGEESFLLWAVCSIQLQDFGADIVDCMNFAIFVNAWDSCSHHWKLPNRDGCNLNSWHIVDSLVRTCITEQVKCSQPIHTSPGSNLPVLLQLVTESLSWHTLVIQSCLRSMVPHGKKKKKSAMDQSNSPQVKAIRATIECLISLIQGVCKCLADQIVGQEDEKLDVLSSHVKGKELQDGPGCVFQALEDYGAANHSECGERISAALQSWSSADVLRKFTGSQKSLLSRFRGICDTKLKLLESMKLSIYGGGQGLRVYCSNFGNLLVHFLEKVPAEWLMYFPSCLYLHIEIKFIFH